MATRILRRAALTVFIAVGVTVIAFFLVRLAPGDPAAQMLPPTAKPEQIAAMRERMGLDEPLAYQFWLYVKGLLHGDLGYSYTFRMDNTQLIFPRLGKTAIITGLGVALALLVALPLGMVAGVRRGSASDFFALGFALLGQAMSPVWLCMLLIMIFSVWLKWLPPEGYGSPAHLVMPSICVGFAFASLVTRMMRAGMIDVLGQEYITAARARGIGRTRIYGRYAFKNALLPIITVSGSQLGILLAGSVVIEQIFSYPGLGQLTVAAISGRDFQLVQSILLVIALLMLATNLLVDVLYTFVDKRVEFN
ncbi:MAG: ABC transporter permease [Bifidobacteriaceae bacterium]|jgi:ABC-type dipeptide/oligopeptide/nickel transport system permease component|nr:ABC transporter permease [Bifidobacteriaceae bacterium]